MTRAPLLLPRLGLALLLVGCTTAGPSPSPETAEPSIAETDTPAPEDSEEPIEAQTLRLSSLVGPTTPDSLTLEWWADQLTDLSDGALDVEFFFSGSLLPGPETLHGVADGRADMGVVPTSFHPGELPLSQLSSVPFITSNTGAYTSAFRELYLTNDDYRAEWNDQGVVPVVWLSNPPPIIGLAEPAGSLDELRGRQIRGFGYITNAMDAVGINAIALPVGEVYESIQRGVIDGYSAVPFEFVTALSLHEVAPHVVGAGLGQYGITALVMRKDLWDSLPQSLQDAIVDLQVEVIERQQDQFLVVGAEVCQALADAGATVTILPDGDIAEWRDTLGDSLIETWNADATGTGVDPAAADDFQAGYLAGLESHDGDWEVRLSVEQCVDG